MKEGEEDLGGWLNQSVMEKTRMRVSNMGNEMLEGKKKTTDKQTKRVLLKFWEIACFLKKLSKKNPFVLKSEEVCCRPFSYNCNLLFFRGTLSPIYFFSLASKLRAKS